MSTDSPPKKFIYPLPIIDGVPANVRRPDDESKVFGINGPARVIEAFEAVQEQYGGVPKWAVLAILIDSHKRYQNVVKAIGGADGSQSTGTQTDRS